MDAALITYLLATGGVLTSTAARTLGLTFTDLRDLTRSNDLTHVARGAYVQTSRLVGATPEGAHGLRARAVASMLGDGVALSHHSAACVMGLPFIGAPPERVHVVRRGPGCNRVSAHYTVHRAYRAAQTTDRRVWRHRGVWLVSPAHAVFGLAAIQGLRHAVAAADAALRLNLTNMQLLREVAAECPRQPGGAAFRSVLDRVDPRAESPGESLTRLVLWMLGYAVSSQVEIRDATGTLVGRVDFLLAEAPVIIEFDGYCKYENANNLVVEKQREDRLRALGYEVVRLVWSDLNDPQAVRRLVEQAIQRARRVGRAASVTGMALRAK